MKCPFCKSEIDEKVVVCPHCTKSLVFHKNPGCAFTMLGIGLSSCGIWLIWIPVIGIPIILVGLLIAGFGMISGISRMFSKKSSNVQ